MGINPLQYTTAARREFDGVSEQIPDNLLKTPSVAGNRSRVWIEHGEKSHPLNLRRWPDRFQGLRDNVTQHQAAYIQANLSGADPAHVEEILDHLRLCSSIALNCLQAL